MSSTGFPEVLLRSRTGGTEVILYSGQGDTINHDTENCQPDTIEKKDGSVPSESESKCPHPPSFFTDQCGNLKFVNLVVRYPFVMFWSILTICSVFTVLLAKNVSKKGNPFVDPGEEYDMKDLRSSSYDSLRLAIDEVRLKRESLGEIDSIKTVMKVKYQEKVVDKALWIYESKTPEGLFGTKQSIQAMKEAYDLFTEEESHEFYCQLKYENVTSECVLPLSPLNMYYASEWDHANAQIIIDELANPENIKLYNNNALGVCVEFGICPESELVDEKDFAWAIALNDNITHMFDTWDGKGELNSDIDQVTLFAAYMAELNTKRGYVSFGYDKNFSLKNLKSFYSRGAFFLGWAIAWAWSP